MIVVKVGGRMGLAVDGVLRDVAELAGQGKKLVLVHGGSHEIDAISEKLGHPPRFVTSVSGHVSRYTDQETIGILIMVMAGRVNKSLVARLQALGVDAVGLSGLDGRVLLARRKEVLRVVDGGKVRALRGDLSGQIVRVNAALLQTLVALGHLPVVAPLALGQNGEALNVDADRAAAAIAGALGAHSLVFLTNVPGLLHDPADAGTLVPHIPCSEIHTYVRQYAQGRMKKKLISAGEALAAGVERVVIADGRGEEPVQRALAGQGTVIGGNHVAVQ